jgi:hypothetical protein
MSATYSINVGGPTEALRKQDINSVLLDLPDNTQKLISPKDVRDAFVTAWANSAFKQTVGQANIEYLGIDSGNPSNRDIKEKIFIGKRSYAGLDIMTNTLLNNGSSDIYIYNTKPDSYLTQSTSIVILAGTNSFLHEKAPYIKSDVITTNNGSALTLEFTNPSLNGGPVNILSSTGRVSVNGILFPTLSETSASASNGKILKYSGTYPNGVLKWSNPDVSISSIGTPTTPMNIYGSPVNVNGYSLEFVNNSIVPQTIGGVTIGSSFSAGSFNGQNWPLSEVIRKILYPYVPPTLSLSISTPVLYLSTGLTYSSIFTTNICRYSNIVYDYKVTGPSGNLVSGLSFSGAVGSCTSSTFSSNVYSNTAGTQSYILSARDDQYLMTYSHSATASIVFTDPIFYGFSSTNVTTGSQLGTFMNSANRYVYPYTGTSQSMSLMYSGSGYLYFVVPSTFPLLSKIKDVNGFIMHDSDNLSISSFTYSANITPVGGNSLPTPVPNWRIYKTVATCSYVGTGSFEFIFL